MTSGSLWKLPEVLSAPSSGAFGTVVLGGEFCPRLVSNASLNGQRGPIQTIE